LKYKYGPEKVFLNTTLKLNFIQNIKHRELALKLKLNITTYH